MKKNFFTLIEVLAVIAVIMILMGLVLTLVPQAREKARRKECASNLNQVGVAIQVYANEKGFQYPFSSISKDKNHPVTNNMANLLKVLKYQIEPNDAETIYFCPSAHLSSKGRDSSYIVHAKEIIDYNELDSTFIFAADRPFEKDEELDVILGNHTSPNFFRNILFADGHVASTTGTKTQVPDYNPPGTGKNGEFVRSVLIVEEEKKE